MRPWGWQNRIIILICLMFGLNLILPTLYYYLYWNLGNMRWAEAILLNNDHSQLIQASHYWEQAKQYNQNQPDVSLYLGSAYERSGNKGAAIASWLHLPTSMTDLLSVGQQWLIVQSPSNAIPWFRGATLIAPTESAPWYYLSQAFIQNKQPNEALVNLEHALSALQPGMIKRSQIYYEIGYVHQYLKSPAQIEQAIDAYHAALDTQDFHNSQVVAEIHFRLCDALWTKRTPPEQYAEECQKAISLDPKHLLAHYLLGIAYYEQYHDVAKAEQEFKSANAIQPSPWGLVMLGAYVYEPAGMLREARDIYQQALEQWPTFELAKQYLSNVAQRL